ncbi:DUF262 domain-containing protein [Listeria booriae]|uniref:DUF262 domain-containing protein n=1 Tax=Listeria booriae TaxID=1552123 RepID=UPI001626166D|nr:DUF262 domain-containing protein [Listeria booriae]MBC2318479.1 DUF262 domain-containing protein [Listeria booriae]MCD2205554.1 DUF262 domain-containing protein [Listeria booriae]
MGLESEINKSMRDIKTDGYSISIGEIANNYKDGDITIFPEYQRYFRWNIKQKSDLIESLILGIPIPPIFVSQDRDAKWDIIDGLQRICTILEFMGVLKKRNSEDYYEASKLIGTKFLPSLENKLWDSKVDTANSLDENTRRIIKRRKINISIIDSTTNNDVKYELFQRLNTTGSELAQQEIRNCLMVMINPSFYKSLIELAEEQDFQRIINLSEKQLREQYDKELITRLFISYYLNLDNVQTQEDMGPYLTDKIVKFMEVIEDLDRAADYEEDFLNIDQFNMEDFSNRFARATQIYKNNLDKNSFRKYIFESGQFKGPFLLSVFEVSFIYVMKDIEKYEANGALITEKIKKIPNLPEFTEGTKPGTRALDRMRRMIKLGSSVMQ